MTTKSSASKTKPINWTLEYKRKLSPDMTVEEFIKRVKESPWEIYKFDMRYVIEQLRDISLRGTQNKSKIAREILKKAGLQAFIPKEASKRKTKNAQLKSWENLPFIFIQDVEHVKDSMRPYWKRLSKKISRNDRNRNCIQASLKSGKKVTNRMIRKLTSGERDKDLTHLALSVLSESYKINFEQLKKTYYQNLYYTDQTTKQKKSYLELLKPSSKRNGVNFEKLKANLSPPFGLTLDNFYDLLNKRDSKNPKTTYPEYIYDNTYKLFSIHKKIEDLAK